MKRLICLAVLLIAHSLSAMPLSSIHWKGDPFVMISRGIPLTSVLQEFGSNYGVPVVISKKINDTFIGRIQNQDPLTVIRSLSRQYNLLWYYNNDILYIYNALEVSDSIVPFTGISTRSLSHYLKDSGILEPGVCRVKPMTGASAVQVTGVPACIQIATQFINQLATNAQKNASVKDVVKVFPLKYASAIDTTYEYRDQPVKIPGLVTVLKQMAEDKQTADSQSGNVSTVSGPVFSADSRRNAVIIRGNIRDVETYGALIKDLDHKPTMIEISVSILDVDASDFNQLGVDWSGSAKIGNQGISFNSDSGGTSVSTVIGDTSNFMIKLKALEQNSKARVLSHPSVVTLNNVQAVLDKNVTFYTKVYGEKVAKLESVTTGTLLRVTPRLIQEVNRKAVMLNLNIQDGQQGDPVSRSDSLPQVQKSEISTQATLTSGQSLLIGGFVQDRDETAENKIPLLGDIPILGRLFRSKNNNVQHVMRLFLIKAQPVLQGN